MSNDASPSDAGEPDPLITDRAIRIVLSKVELYAERSGLAESTIGRHALSDSLFIKKMRTGWGFTVDKMKRLEQWLDLNLQEPMAPKRGRPRGENYRPRRREPAISE